MTELHGKDFVALRRLSTRDDTTIAAPKRPGMVPAVLRFLHIEVGDTCERVTAATGGTVSEALQRLLDSGKIAPALDQPKATAKRTKGDA